jgi:hypothetical protein
MDVPLLRPNLNRRDLQVKHLVKNDGDEYVFRCIRTIEDVVDPNATPRGGDTSERALEKQSTM